jgi:spermidine/putrescine transport system substrate-binding protein
MSLYDRATRDLERDLIAWMAERRISRRVLLERIAKVGAATALAPVVVACSRSVGPPSATPAPTTPAPPTGSVAPTPTPVPTPVPTPEKELFVYNWAEYMGETVVPSFEKKYGIKVTYDFFDNYDAMYAKIGQDGGGYDITFPTSVDIPSLVQRGLIQELDQGLLPNKVNLGPEWQNPGYDPGNTHSMPYMWWTTGVAYDSKKIKEDLTSWAALWDERWKGHINVLDDSREAFAMALFRLGKDVNTTNDADLDAATDLLKQQKPLVRSYSTDDIGVLSSGDAWISHAWGSDVYQVVGERPSVKFYIPEEGGVRGSDTMVILKSAKHPVAANLFINHCLDAKISAENTNYIGYMGPNQAAKEFIDKAILKDPTVNPDQAVIEKLQELLDLGPDLQKYTDRWNQVKAG